MSHTDELNKALVDVFNIHSYGSNVDTNFLLQGSDIIVSFSGNQAFGEEYLKFMGEEVRKEHFLSKKDASMIFKLDSFPFSIDKGRWEQSEDDKEEGVIKFIIHASSEVILNLERHFMIERISVVCRDMIAELLNAGYDDEEARSYLGNAIGFKMERRGFRDYLCLSFCAKGFMDNFIQKHKTDMGWDNDNFLDRWEVDDLSMCARYVNLEDIKRAIKETRELIGCFFDVPSSNNQRVKRYKNAISDLIFRLTGVPIFAYDRDVYVDQDRIENGEYFAFIPEVIKKSDGLPRYLDSEEVSKINAALGYDILNDVEGKTFSTQLSETNGIYALSNKQIALLISEIIENSVVARADNGYGLVVDSTLERCKSRTHSNLWKQRNAQCNIPSQHSLLDLPPCSFGGSLYPGSSSSSLPTNNSDSSFSSKDSDTSSICSNSGISAAVIGYTAALPIFQGTSGGYNPSAENQPGGSFQCSLKGGNSSGSGTMSKPPSNVCDTDIVVNPTVKETEKVVSGKRKPLPKVGDIHLEHCAEKRKKKLNVSLGFVNNLKQKRGRNTNKLNETCNML